MKKLFSSLVFLLLSSTVAFANNPYPYSNPQPINDIGNIRCKGDYEYIDVSPKGSSKFDSNFIRNMLGAGIVGAAIVPALLFDPYIVNIDGVNYVLVKDRKDNNWSEKDLLGIDDPKNNRFESLIKLNSDRDFSKVTSDELKKAGIRFVRMNSKGALLVNDRTKDYDLNKVAYIDIINLKRTANSEQTGIFGHFTVYVKAKNNKTRAIVGHVTYETDKKIEVLFK